MIDYTYYLSSLDSVRFEPVRECVFERMLVFDTGKEAVEARLSPTVIGQDFGHGSDLAKVILSARHEGVSIYSIEKFPCFVFIAIPRAGSHAPQSPIRADELQVIGWGELYRTKEDAKRHSFD
ncbi:hypothetical protein Athai_45080 [Actinocatenispora thailandica]|uniref:Uncharacterized protein n=1 Tax=Actinocatenispora thailandica TaxID=227318 RepID=A0A7R7DSC5_9ACTN|nr:hypothetical protein [Actinocatenispora thailandica]BCJ37005.1 hypothetical protein Athai_45080 [Actinocatenispora thailandica]